MSEQKLSGHTEELPGGGLRFIFDEPVTIYNDDAIAITMEWSINSENNIVGEAILYRDAPRVALEWVISYDNDTGPSDESFAEWWTVTDGERNFTCKSEDDANWLCNLLNQYE